MSARADMVTIDGAIECTITTDKGRAVFRLEPLELLALAGASRDYAMRVLHKHASRRFDAISRPLREMTR